jgi:GT2 family glycosyltransferase
VPRLSIVIPVLGDPQQLDDTLLSVLENRPANCEILVVHNQPYHDPYNLSDEVRFVEAEHGTGMVECLNRGLAASRSPVIHVLTCKAEVCPGWADAALRHFGNPTIAAVAAVVLNRDDRRKVVSAGLGYRVEGTVWRLGRQNRPDELTASEQDLCGPDILAAFYRKSAIQSVGGFSPWTGDALAGIDLALALRHAGFRCALEPQCVAHVGAAATYTESAFRCGRNAERLFWRRASSQGWLPSLVGHVALLAGQSVIALWRPSMLVQLAGRLCGAFQAVFAEHGAKPADNTSVETPSVVAAPHFTVTSRREQRQSSRVA